MAYECSPSPSPTAYEDFTDRELSDLARTFFRYVPDEHIDEVKEIFKELTERAESRDKWHKWYQDEVIEKRKQYEELKLYRAGAAQFQSIKDLMKDD